MNKIYEIDKHQPVSIIPLLEKNLCEKNDREWKPIEKLTNKFTNEKNPQIFPSLKKPEQIQEKLAAYFNDISGASEIDAVKNTLRSIPDLLKTSDLAIVARVLETAKNRLASRGFSGFGILGFDVTISQLRNLVRDKALAEIPNVKTQGKCWQTTKAALQCLQLLNAKEDGTHVNYVTTASDNRLQTLETRDRRHPVLARVIERERSPN